MSEDGVVDAFVMETTLGRALFNDALPPNYAYVNEVVDKKRLSGIVNDLAERYTKVAGRREPRLAQGRRVPLGHPLGHHGRGLRRADAGAQDRDPVRLRGQGRQGRSSSTSVV